MRDYYDLYVQTDTLLLADVFQKFREGIEIYGHDPSYFYSETGLAQKSCLKKTGVKLELSTDIDVIDGRKRYQRRNTSPVNEFMWHNVNEFMWHHLSDFNEEIIKNYNENSDVGYFLEVDLAYPKNYLIFIKTYHFYLREKKLGKVEKRVCSIEAKEKYVIHIRALTQALNHGVILKEVHRVIKFNQETWLKPYIDMNTQLKKEAKNDFEKDFFKLMNNSVFRKTMENMRKHRDIKLVTTGKRIIKLV